MNRLLALLMLSLFSSLACKSGGDDKGAEDKSVPPSTVTAPVDASAPRPPDFEKGCASGDMEQCRALGVRLASGDGADPERAADLFASACGGGNAAACSNLAMATMTGHGVARDAKQAVVLYQQACDGGHSLGCRNLALAHLRGHGVPADPVRAVALFESACESGSALACTNWGMALRDGVGTAKDEKRGVEILVRACNEGDAAGCRHLGVMYAAGQAGLPAGAPAAKVWFQRSCEGLDSKGCLALGLLQLENPKELADARKSLGAACAAKEIVACEIMVKRGWAERSVETTARVDAGP